MPDAGCLLKFSEVAAGGAGHWHIYNGQHYVGTIGRSYGGWCVRHREVLLGTFADLEEATGAVVEWYYGPGAPKELDGTGRRG